MKLKKKIKRIRINRVLYKKLKKKLSYNKRIKLLIRSKKKNYRIRRRLRKKLHVIKRKLLHVNIRNKRNRYRRLYWLSQLPFYKTEVDHRFCSSLIYNPLLLQTLLRLRPFVKKRR